MTTADIEIDERRCYVCKIVKPLVDFYTDRGATWGRAGRCIACAAIQNKRWRVENKEKASLVSRKTHIKMKYGISWEEFERVYSTQDGRCAICTKELQKASRDTCIDHDHLTGVIRGVLCRKCNTGLGQFCDDLLVLKKAVTYLEQWSQKDD